MTEFNGTIGRPLADSEPHFMEPPHPGDDAPNVVFVTARGGDAGRVQLAHRVPQPARSHLRCRRSAGMDGYHKRGILMRRTASVIRPTGRASKSETATSVAIRPRSPMW